MTADQPDLGGVLVLAYCQLHILELMCEGTGRNDAAKASYDLWNGRLMDLAPASARLQFAAVNSDRTFRFGCLAQSASRSARVLQDLDVPAELLSADDVGRVRWLLETLRRVAAGGDPAVVAARAAYDAHLGRPRQRRRPVEVAWLHQQVVAALDAIWKGIRDAPAGAYGLLNWWGRWAGRFTEHPDPERPVATGKGVMPS